MTDELTVTEIKQRLAVEERRRRDEEWLRGDGPYQPRGRTDEASYDYTDDPRALASRFSRADLLEALEEGDSDFGQLKFDYEEWVPKKAIREALRGVRKAARDGDGDGLINEGTPSERWVGVPGRRPADRQWVASARTNQEAARRQRAVDAAARARTNAEAARILSRADHPEKEEREMEARRRAASRRPLTAAEKLAEAEYKLAHWEDYYDDGELIAARQELPKLRRAAERAARLKREAELLGRHSQSRFEP